MCPLLAADLCKQSVPDGWTFNSKMDSGGNDLGNSAAAADGNWTNAAAVCGANPYCMGVNTDGWLKYTIVAPAQWVTTFGDPCKGLLVKQGVCVFVGVAAWPAHAVCGTPPLLCCEESLWQRNCVVVYFVERAGF
jgi:hypothetical protein